MLLALAAYVASLPVQTIGARPLFGHAVYLSELVFLGCAALAIPVGLRRGWWRRLGALELWGAFYLLAAALATVTSEEPAASLSKLVGVGYLVGLGAITHLALDAAWKRRLLVSVWLAAAAASATLSLAGGLGFYLGFDEPATNPFLRHSGTLPPGPYPRVGALFFNVNMLCNYLIVALALAWERWAERPRWWPHGLLVAGLAAAGLLTFSIGIGGMILAVALLAWRRPPAGAVAGSVALRRGLVAAGLALAILILAAGTVAPSEDGGLQPSLRARTWQDGLQTFLADPLTGKGLGLPVTAVDVWVPAGRVIHLTDAHNVWINFGAQAGLGGLAALAGLFAWALWRGFAAAPPGDSGPSPRVLAIALVGAIGYHGLAGSFEDARHVWLLLGLLAASVERG